MNRSGSIEALCLPMIFSKAGEGAEESNPVTAECQTFLICGIKVNTGSFDLLLRTIDRQSLVSTLVFRVAGDL